MTGAHGFPRRVSTKSQAFISKKYVWDFEGKFLFPMCRSVLMNQKKKKISFIVVKKHFKNYAVETIYVRNFTWFL